MTKLIPQLDRIVAREVPKEERTRTGLWIPKTAAENNQGVLRGIVESVGPGHYDANGVFVAPTVKPGDMILFGQYAANQVILEDDQTPDGKVIFFIVRNCDIMAVMIPELPVTVEALLGDGPKAAQ